MSVSSMFDVVIVGAGPAGLNAALVLGRSRRRVLVCDTGRPRNAASQAMHGFLTRDGIHPAEFARIGREQLAVYDTVEFRDIEVRSILPAKDQFAVTLQDGTQVTAKRILLATGLVDQLPELEGLPEHYGRSIFHCPYCDGWEVRDQPLAIYGRGENGPGLALELTGWSLDLVLCTNGPAQLSDTTRQKLADNRIEVREDMIARLEGNNGVLERIVFDNGGSLERRAMFFNLGHQQHSSLATRLGCELAPDRGDIVSDRHESTNVPGIYVAGDAASHSHMAIIAASEGAIAALAINTELLRQEVKARSKAVS
jgi:thioredoxin reductase